MRPTGKGKWGGFGSSALGLRVGRLARDGVILGATSAGRELVDEESNRNNADCRPDCNSSNDGVGESARGGRATAVARSADGEGIHGL